MGNAWMEMPCEITMIKSERIITLHCRIHDRGASAVLFHPHTADECVAVIDDLQCRLAETCLAVLQRGAMRN